MARARYAACMGCRAKAQSVAGVTEAQAAGLKKGSVKGTNYRTGYKHREESKRKVSASNKAFWAANPEKAKERGAKTAGDKHHGWKGGASRLNTSIRQMTENRRWMDAVRERDMRCMSCGSDEELEAHHCVSLADLVAAHGVKTRADARNTPALWDTANGKTLCRRCHHAEHGRDYTPSGSGRKHTPKIRKERSSGMGNLNPNWKGGLIEKSCLGCGKTIKIKPCIAAKGQGKFCERKCFNAYRRS